MNDLTKTNILLSETMYDDGNLFEREFYRNGKLEGEHKIWYINGQLYKHDFYREDQLEGECKSWHDNGVLWVREFYCNGLRNGEYGCWDSDGRLFRYSFYRHEKLIVPCFTFQLKYTLLKIKTSYHKSRLSFINKFLISDLVKVSQYFIPS